MIALPCSLSMVIAVRTHLLGDLANVKALPKQCLVAITVNLEFFARILFSRIALNYTFASLKNREQGMIYLYMTECTTVTKMLITFQSHGTLIYFDQRGTCIKTLFPPPPPL